MASIRRGAKRHRAAAQRPRGAILPNEPKYISDLKRVSRERPDLVDAFFHHDRLAASDDRAAAIIVTTRLEDEIKELILSAMIDLNQTETGNLFIGDKPLATFSAKIDIAYALGLIGKRARSDFTLIRLIRNVFAHARQHITFDKEEIAAACAKLTLLDRFEAISEWRGIEQPANTPRLRFIGTVKLYGIGILTALRPEILALSNPPSSPVPLD